MLINSTIECIHDRERQGHLRDMALPFNSYLQDVEELWDNRTGITVRLVCK